MYINKFITFALSTLLECAGGVMSHKSYLSILACIQNLHLFALENLAVALESR